MRLRIRTTSWISIETPTEGREGGCFQNYIDVGAEDCGSLIALGNTFANLGAPPTERLAK